MRRLRVHPLAGAVLGTAAALLLCPRRRGRAASMTARRRRDDVTPAERPRVDAARIRAEESGRRAAFLAEASRVLAGSLDDAATLKSMARVAVPYLADYVLVDILDEAQRLRRVAAVHARPEIEPALSAARPCAGTSADEPGFGPVLRHGDSIVVREIGDAWLAAHPFEATHLGFPALRPTSVMLVPLRARGRALGIVTLARTGDRRYGLADLAVAEDLAQRAALAADNARLYREAQDASRAKDEFLAVLSHELRTPLTPVLGWVRLLRAGLPPDTAGRALETVERNARLQLRLVDDLLDVSRIVTGTLRLDLRPLALGPVLDAALDAVAASAAEKGIAITREIASDVPLVEADAGRLQQALGHVLSNAVKFTPHGGRVAASIARVDAAAVIVIADTGEGLPPHVVPHIFERFRQADSTLTRSYGGLGLGLAIVRHIVDLHGGTVAAASDGPGHGTTITIRLPATRPGASASSCQ